MENLEEELIETKDELINRGLIVKLYLLIPPSHSSL